MVARQDDDGKTRVVQQARGPFQQPQRLTVVVEHVPRQQQRVGSGVEGRLQHAAQQPQRVGTDGVGAQV